MIMVTGGVGFIGSNLVHELNLQGEDAILVVDHLSDATNPQKKPIMQVDTAVRWRRRSLG